MPDSEIPGIIPGAAIASRRLEEFRLEVFPLVGPVFSLPGSVKFEWRNAPPDYADPFDASMKTNGTDHGHALVDIIGSSQAPQVESETPTTTWRASRWI